MPVTLADSIADGLAKSGPHRSTDPESGAREHAPPRFRLLTGDDLRAMPAMRWRVRGLFPDRGVVAIYGPSASGKSFLSLDQGAAIAEGADWFNLRTKPAHVVYVALEGEAGIARRVLAWETANRRTLPASMHVVLDAFRLTSADDVVALAAAVPAGAVVYIDTTNRAAPGADENSSVDMGRIVEGAKRLADITGGLVVLVHHTGKDASKGMRGHSSLFAALDGAIEVMRDGERREWRSAKSKDGADGDAYPFRLAVVELGEDDEGAPVSSCVVRPDARAAEVQQVALPQGGNQRLVLDAIRPLFKDGAKGKPGAPPLRPCIELEAAVRIGGGALTCEGKRRNERTRAAITGLVTRGVLGLHEGWLWLV